MKVQNRQLVFKSPGRGVIVGGKSWYTEATGVRMMRYWGSSTRSDISDALGWSYSEDNGRTWSATQPAQFIFQTPAGTFERGPGLWYTDPENGRLLALVTECELPTGVQPQDARESQKRSYLCYQVSEDGGRTNRIYEQIVQKGPYTPDHPVEGVWKGKNAIGGSMGGVPIRTRAGKILVPVTIFPLGSDGKIANPGGGFTWEDAAVLIGTWLDDGRMEWDMSERIVHDPNQSTRGCAETTITEMPDGRILNVIRGSNDVKPELPSYKWYTVSADGGYTWSPLQPWTYSDGTNFFSPSSCSQFLHHSNGKYYWFGNITERNPHGSLPRYPLIGGVVDPESLLLIRDSVTVLADRRPEDHPLLQLSNFLAYEDRETGDIRMELSPIAPMGPTEPDWSQAAWTGDAYVYRIAV